MSNGVSRRAWSGNHNADITIRRAMEDNEELVVTLPHQVQDTEILETLF